MIRRRAYPMEIRKVPKALPVEVRRTDPAVWAKALELADGDVRRLVRVSETEVIVRNPGEGRQP